MDFKNLLTDKVAFDFGAFSHVYRTMFESKHTVSVQYLMWQGAEFHITFNAKHEADHVLKNLFEYFNKGKKADIRYGHGWSERIYDFDIDNCISPTELLKYAQSLYPESKLVLTPTNSKMSTFYFGENNKVAIDTCLVTREQDSPFRRYSFYPYDERLSRLLQ